ncbi:MAG TPA: hypothetical protein VGG39_35430 [Polyangiaceae bacterium]
MKRLALYSTFGLLALACGSSLPPQTAAPGGTTDQRHWPADDRSLCDGFVHWKSNPQLEVSETVGPGSIRPNIRRVYKVVGEREDRHQVLQCREIDTNLDGLKDVVRTFNEKGEPLHEEADTNYDGKIDDWINFADGRIAEEDIDTTMSAGRPNVWKFYLDGQLSRIRRNTHCPSGKPDTWEIYFHSKLERVGNDISCDGHIDRWDRDAQLMAQEEAQSGVEIVDGGSSGTAPVTVGTSGQVIDGGPPGDAGKGRRPRR